MIFGNALAFLLKPNTITENRKQKQFRRDRERTLTWATYLATYLCSPPKPAQPATAASSVVFLLTPVGRARGRPVCASSCFHRDAPALLDAPRRRPAPLSLSLVPSPPLPRSLSPRPSSGSRHGRRRRRFRPTQLPPPLALDAREPGLRVDVLRRPFGRRRRNPDALRRLGLAGDSTPAH